jgi:hypothetical protein
MENHEERASLPYGGTSGWSGTLSSEERAHRRDASGRTGKLQGRVLRHVQLQGARGATIKELREHFPDEHHGSLSGALTAMHKTGRLIRTDSRRDRCSVYIGAMALLAGRKAIPPSRGVKSRMLDLLDELRLQVEVGNVTVDDLRELIERYER